MPLPVQTVVYYALIFLPLYLPLILGLRIIAAGDSIGFDYPALRALHPFSLSSLLADPYVGRGYPWLVTYGTLDPLTHILRLFFDEFRTLAWIGYISYVGGSFFFSLLLVRHGFSRTAAFIGGLIYTCSFWAGLGEYTGAYTLLTFALALLLIDIAPRRPVLAALGIAAVTLHQWFATHFNYVVICLLGELIFCVYTCVRSSEASKKRYASLASLIVGVGIGTVLSLVKMLPALAYVTLSERGSGLSLAAATADSLSLSSLSALFFPFLHVPFLTQPGDTGLLYGIAGVALLLVGLFTYERSMRPVLWGWLLTCLVALPYSPLYWVLYHLPLMHFLRGPVRFLFLGNACAAVVIAHVFDQWGRNKKSHLRARIVGIALCVIGAIAACLSVVLMSVQFFAGQTVVVAMQRYFDTHLYKLSSGLPLAHYHAYLAQLWSDTVRSFSLLSPQFLLPLVLLLVTGILLVRRSSWTSRTKLPLVCLLICSAVWGLFFHYPYARLSTLQAVREQPFMANVDKSYVMPVMPGLADFLQRENLPPGSDAHMAYQLELLLPDAHALVSVRSIDFYQPMQPRRMGRLLAYIGSDTAVASDQERLSSSKQSLPDRLQTLADRSVLLAALNIRYMVSAWQLPAPFSQRGATSFNGLPTVYIYEVPGVRSLAYAPEKAVVFAPDENRAVQGMEKLHDSTLSILECAACTFKPAAIRATVVRDEALELRVNTSSQSDGWLVLSRPRLPGWRTLIDGVPVKTAIANALFVGVPVPAGNHVVSYQLTYGALLEDSASLLLSGTDRWLL